MEPRFLSLCLNPTIQKTYVFGRLDQGEVNRALLVRTDASGKGVNVARVLSEAGAKAVHITHLGGSSGEWFLSLCQADGIDVRWVDSRSPVRICSTVIEEETRQATELVEESAPVAEGTEERILALFRDQARLGGFLILSGSKAAGYSPSVFPRMLRMAAEAGVPALLDIRGPDLLACLPFKPAAAKPNLQEFLATFPPSLEEASLEEGSLEVGSLDGSSLERHIEATLRRLKSDYGTDFVLTRGDRPVLFLEDGRLSEMEVEKTEVVNPIGSGDAFAAGMAMVLADGGSLKESVRRGIEFGRANASELKIGTIGGRRV